ncbi:MAG: NADP-dependent L-serine/L-allo-threonine dehydrogenase ydfG [Chlamydiota bacterium]|jgi:NADP-dependent 3-hydroxy acid dehydrogenase YdfG
MITGQTALITGASSGMGKACAERLAAMGVNLVLAARRKERLEEMVGKLDKVKVRVAQLDVKDYTQVEALEKELDKEGVDVDILINCAGLALGTNLLQQGHISDWETTIDTNIKGLLYMTRIFLPGMLKRDRGHIVNIGSVAGHECYRGGSVYAATKHAVRALSQSTRLDTVGSKLRVSEIDPGCVHTEFSEVRWKDKEKAEKFYQGFEPLVAEDIADAVVYCLTRPPHVNISEMIIYPQAQPCLNEIHRAGQVLPKSFGSR